MSRMSRIHDDYLDPDRHLWPESGDEDPCEQEPPEFDRKPDAYGHLCYCVGSDDDFWCFDYVISKCRGWVSFDVTINSETGSFIMDGGSEVVPAKEALSFAEDAICGALDWCGENEVDPDWAGWNTTENKFVNDLKGDLK